MLKNIQLIFLFAIAISCDSHNLMQTANYKQVELKIPSTWNYKSQEIESNFVYQISCWEKDAANSFILQWIESEMDLEEYLEIMKESLKEQFTHKNVVFENYKAGVFQNYETLYSSFSGELLDFKFTGKLIAFNNNGMSFLIMHQGNDEFYTSKTADKIISTLKIGFLKELAQPIIPETWTLYEIENIGQLAVPSTLELRDDNSFTALAADIIHDNYVTHKKIEMTKSQLIFQPKGSNGLDKGAFSIYARIMIRYSKGGYGDFYKWNEKFELTNAEYKELDDYFKNEIVSQIQMAKINNKLINWYPIEIGNINELSYIKTSFTRQMADNPIVKVARYNFFNSNEAVEIILSYRLSESDIWASDFSKVTKTFSFNTKK